MSTLTVAEVIDRARSRSPFFAMEDNANEGALVAAIEDRQRTLLLKFGGAVQGLVTTSVEIAAVINGILVGSDDGVPYFLTTYQDGWPVHSEGGVPYVDFSEVPIAGDPFGENGGTPGFPLPADFVKLVDSVVVYDDSRIGPLNIVGEPQRLARTRWATPTAFLNGNRLVPIRPLAENNASDVWAQSIASIQLSYVAAPRVRTRSDTITLPAPLLEALITHLCDVLCAFASTMPEPQKARFAKLAAAAEDAIDGFSGDLTDTASTNSVTFRG